MSSIFRVTVRGRFADLTSEARRYLTSAADDHDVFKSSYTSEGTFTYDRRLDFFNLRYEVRSGDETPSESAAQQAQHEAETFLRTMGFGYRNLKVSVVDMSAMWADVDLRRTR